MKFCRELYSKIALMKAAYNYIDIAYIHLDADDKYFYVTIEPKESNLNITEQEFINEMLTQSVRHEVYKQTKNIRELLLARAMASSVVVNDPVTDEEKQDTFKEDDILKDWFAENEKIEN